MNRDASHLVRGTILGNGGETMNPSSINITVTMPANPSDVFAALTNAKLMSAWSEQKGKVEPKVGGKFEMFDGWVKGKVLAYKPGKALAYTWLPGDWEEAVESKVQYKFAATKTGTKVTLTHTGFPNEKERKNHREGWFQFVFDPLKEYFQSQQA